MNGAIFSIIVHAALVPFWLVAGHIPAAWFCFVIVCYALALKQAESEKRHEPQPMPNNESPEIRKQEGKDG